MSPLLARLFPRISAKREEAESRRLAALLDRGRLPGHVAIILDGEGRSERVGVLESGAGQRAGGEALRRVVGGCLEVGVPILTVYAFSTENWKRPREEVELLMELLCEYAEKELASLREQGVQVRVIGRVADLPERARAALARVQTATAGNRKLILNIALNYGGRLEIVEAARELARRAREGSISPEEIDEDVFARHLYTAGLPDPDLLIRPAGEQRISNFLLWQVAYTEFWFTRVFWPDFQKRHLLEALVAYQQRERRFGGL